MSYKFYDIISAYLRQYCRFYTIYHILCILLPSDINIKFYRNIVSEHRYPITVLTCNVIYNYENLLKVETAVILPIDYNFCSCYTENTNKRSINL